jgi:signal peptidase I
MECGASYAPLFLPQKRRNGFAFIAALQRNKMNIFKKRKARKELKEALHYAKHVRHMHEDIGDPEKLALLRSTEEQAKAARKSGQGMDEAMEALDKICLQVAPPRKQPKIRENIEVLFVAIAAAMAIRAYFFQPFKIPTGSMQPTLYGINIRNTEPGESESFPARIVKMVAKGEVYIHHNTPLDRIAKKMLIGKPYTIRAEGNGYIQTKRLANGSVQAAAYRDNFNNQNVMIHIGNTQQSIPYGFLKYCRLDEQLKAGDPLFKGVAKAGDYILVNRMKYNFMRPSRGDIVVFDATDVARDAYYIKRLVGLPGETISLDPKLLLVNGEQPTDSRFDKIFDNDDYSGYVFARPGPNQPALIAGPEDSIVLKNDEYLFFGDNTRNSLDGRYFGGVKQKRLLGSAFFVAMPFDRAGFAETSH